MSSSFVGVASTAGSTGPALFSRAVFSFDVGSEFSSSFTSAVWEQELRQVDKANPKMARKRFIAAVIRNTSLLGKPKERSCEVLQFLFREAKLRDSR